MAKILIKTEASAPSAPGAGYGLLYPLSTDKILRFVDQDGVSVLLTGGSLYKPTGRLTLTTATPVTTADVTAAGTLYYTPYNGDMLPLWNGTKWVPYSFSELSLSLAGYTANKPYDIWVYDNVGTLALDKTIWTNDTTRATALALQSGVKVKSGDASRRYAGTIYTDAAGAACTDSLIRRGVWNYYNRVPRKMGVREVTGHTYSGAWRKWNNSDTNNLFTWVVGVAEDTIEYTTHSQLSQTGVEETQVYLDGVGLDFLSLTTNPANDTASNSGLFVPSSGKHILQTWEYGDAASSGFLDNRMSLLVYG